MDATLRGALEAGERAGVRYALAPLRRAPAGVSGSQLGQVAGSSLEFREYRAYQPGDDLRRLDWGAYARSDKLIVRLYQQEVQPHLDLLLDGSRSMALPGTAKAAGSLGLAALLATAASQAHYGHRAWLAGEGWAPIFNGTKRASSWRHIALDAASNLERAFQRRPPQLRPRSIRVLISDLLWMGEPRQVLGPLVEGAAVAVVLQVLAAQDISPQPGGFVQLVDSEDGTRYPMRLNEQSIQRYQEALQRHMEVWHDTARRMGVSLVTLCAESLVDGWKLDPLVAIDLLRVKM